MQSQHQRWDPESEVILLRAMPKSFVKQFWNILYMLVSSVCVFSISFRGISFSMLVPRHPKVWQSDFCHRLRIRFQTHHSKCTQCLRHRLIIRKLGHNGPARRAQHQELQNHLARQHSDRKVYWECRSRSRLHSTSLGNLGTFELCGILDSMDAVKYAWPRSQVMSSKLFCNFNRPRMSCTALLLHGHLCLSDLTPNTISCNSSRTAEIVAHGLSFLIQKNVDLRNAFFHLQADNASKECKNQCLLRHLGVQVALKKLKGAQMSFLTSGHSHEDIDAMFALLRSWLQRTPEIHTPSDFRDRLQAFFDDPSHRPYEKFREVVMMSRFRDWISSIGLALHDTNFQMFFGKDMERFLSIVVFENSLE